MKGVLAVIGVILVIGGVLIGATLYNSQALTSMTIGISGIVSGIFFLAMSTIIKHLEDISLSLRHKEKQEIPEE